MKNLRLLLSVLLIATLGLGFLAGFWVPRDDDFFALRKNFQIFGAVYEELVGNYVDPLDAERIMRTGIEAMLQDLDPYTVFFDEADNTNIGIASQGKYGEVGLNVGLRNGKVTVSAPQEDASGYKQGVRTGDVITEIGGQSTEGLSLRDVYSVLRGEPGTVVEVTVVREGEPEPLRYLLTREERMRHNVSYSGFVGDDTSSGLGYVKLERFGRGAAAETRKAIQALNDASALKGLVLDLRDNPGGLLNDAVDISQFFVPNGSTIVSTRGRTSATERVYRSTIAPIMPDLPLVVLVNEISASASEIVAGAMQDLDRGVVVGVPSYGKGLVQIVKPLPYNTSLKITTSKYYTPSGRSIQSIDYGQHDGAPTTMADSLRRSYTTARGRIVRDGGGIEPDVLVSLGNESELEQALRRRAAFFFYANHYAATHPSVAPDFTVTDATLKDFRSWLDSQNFTYRTAAERDLERLADLLAANAYTGTRDELADLQKAVQQEKANDFERHETRLKEELREEILARYYGRTAQVKASLANDPQFNKATELLRDSRAYGRVLK